MRSALIEDIFAQRLSKLNCYTLEKFKPVGVE